MNSVGGVIRRASPAEHTNSRGGRHILMKLVTLFNVNLPEDILMNLKFLKLKGLLFCCLTAATATAQPPARVMLDDFTRITTWCDMGGTVNPEENIYWSRCGSFPDASRPDGYCAKLTFDAAGREAEFGMGNNRVFLQKLDENAEGIRLQVNPCGFNTRFTADLKLSDGQLIRTAYVPASGDGWREIFIPFPKEKIAGRHPFSVYRLVVWFSGPARGEIFFDDVEVDFKKLPEDLAPLTAEPVYRKLGWRPGEQVTPEYLFRNRLSTPFSGEITVKGAGKEFTRKIELPPYGLCYQQFDFGSFDTQEPHPVAVAFGGEPLHLGWISVFEPNSGPVNKRPMWFSVEDQELNNCYEEGVLHASWLPLLGVDMIRAGLMGNAQMAKGKLRAEALRKLWTPPIEAGVKLLIDYAGYMPPWVIRPNPTSPLDCRWEEFDALMTEFAKFFGAMPEARYFEFINEPNLNHSRTMTDDYLTALSRLYPIFKKHAPHVKITTGGFCPAIPGSQPQFIERLLARPEIFDVIAYHEHGNYPHYRFTFDIVKKIAGPGHKPIINTEAATRSFMAAPREFYAQADQLVRKITYSKAVGMEYYNWFMMQDYWDKGIGADDTFSLVTVYNQPKPSFLAYAELIRQLSNRDFSGMAELDPLLEAFRFTGETDEVTVVWEKRRADGLKFVLRSDVPVLRTDIYGNTRTLKPQNGLVTVESASLPFYLKAPKGKLQAQPRLLSFRDGLAAVPGERVKTVVTLVNPLPQALRYRLKLGGRSFSGELKRGESREIPVNVTIPAEQLHGESVIPAELILSDRNGKVFEDSLPIPYVCCVEIPEKGAPEKTVVLDSPAALRELVFVPTIPRWSGKEDLSATLSFSWSGEGLHVRCRVTDQEHNGDHTGPHIWKNDSIQFGLDPMNGRNWSEYTFSLTGDGAAAWNHNPPEGFKSGKFDGACSVTRRGNLTEYSFTIPPERLGFELKDGTQFRIALLINDSDGGIRSRTMLFFDGLDGHKDTGKFGLVQLRSGRRK